MERTRSYGSSRKLEDSGVSAQHRSSYPLVSLYLCLLLVAVDALATSGTEPWKKSEKSAERGAEVLLPCILISSQCGGLHSIKWYHGNTRIFIFSESAGLTSVVLTNSDIATRATMDYTVNSTKTHLRIPDVKLEDEGLYKCEATYLSVNRECNNVQHITLNVNVRPDYVRVIEKDGNTNLTSGNTLGPINEGKVINLRCETGEGKPVPTVEWYNGSKLLKGDDNPRLPDSEIGPGSNELKMTVGRNELGSMLTCKVSSPALDEPLTVDIKLNIHVSPEKMDVKGFVGQVVSGAKILLVCTVSAARPAANVTWYNGTELLEDGNERLEIFKTSTEKNAVYPDTEDTISHLAFTATEYDNGRDISCYAQNSVTVAERIKPMKAVANIEVLYAPIVELRQENITVNETEDFDLYCYYVSNPSELKAVHWFLDDEELDIEKKDHYEGGNPGFAHLTVKNSSAEDMGRYTCVLDNSVGSSKVEDFIDVSVLYKPEVKVTMEPEVPVNEAERLNVSLTCEVVNGNPMTLTTVRWFLDGDLLKELPDCARNSSLSDASGSGGGGGASSVNGILLDDASTFCDIDPSKLLLEAVGRSFNGNYACEGRNDAGWGERSPSAPVVVHYKPGPAKISYEPKRVVKKGWLNITCSVQDRGRPEVKGYKWYQGSHLLANEKPVLRIEPVDLRTKANFTCMAYNEAGEGDPATVFIDVAARPAFIQPLKGYAGVVYNATNVSIDCWVECSPICNISWTRDGAPMDFDSTDLYYQTNVYHPPDQSKNDFESIQSTLVWNMTAWPDGHLHPFKDNENFTCESSGNGIGPGVKSETVFRVEFPPVNMTISKETIDVIVDYIPESVECTAVAEPEPMFRWFREGSSEVISTDAVHVFTTKVPRRSNGTYICQAHNRHGTQNITTKLNVLFKPECRIDEERIDGEYYLVCSAVANPKECSFTWSVKSDNDTLDQVGEVRDGKGYLRLDTSVTNFRTYKCIANNTIDFSVPCERGVPARHGLDSNLPWWLQLEGDFLIIVIIIAMVVLLAIIICCVVIWLICRRKRTQAKYSNRVVELEEREHPDGGPPSPTESSRSHTEGSPGSSLHPTPAPRWPLKPGVLVHINRTHSLRSGLGGSARANDTLRIHSSSGGFANDRYRSRPPPSIVRTPIRPFRRGGATGGNKETVNQRALSAVSVLHDEGMIARANRIRAIFGAQLKEPDAFPGISREKTAVTYKRIAPAHQQRVLQLSAPSLPDRAISLNAVVSRKRKKPGADPSQATNNNHVDSVSESLPETEGKTFYENLPFHGIQTPPNKLVTSPKFARVSALHGNSNSNSISIVNGRSPNEPATSVVSSSSAATCTKTTRNSSSNSTDAIASHSATASPCSSAPASLSRATSLCGASSGYESATTRSSHLGPHYSAHNMPRSNSPEPKYNTLKPLRRRKHKQAHSRFYSLRLCRKHSEAAAVASTPSTARRSYQLYAIPIVKSCPHARNGQIAGSNSTIATTLRSTPDATPTSTLSRSKNSSPLPTPPPTPPISSPPASPATNLKRIANDSKTPPIPAPRTKKTDPSRHTYQNVPPPIFPTRNKAATPPPLAKFTKLKLNNLYNYQEYYQQHQKQQEQHYQLQQQEMQQYGSYSTGGSGIPSSSLSQLTLPLTRGLYHSSVVSPLETSFMPAHTHNSVGRPHAHHQTHHQFATTTLHPQHRSEESRGLISGGGGGGENNSSSNSPPLSLVHGNSDLELSSYALDHQLQLQQSSRRSSSNQQLQQHSGRRNERRKYTRKQHAERNNERKTKHRRAAESRVRGGCGLVSDTSDLLMTISNSGGGVIPTSGVTSPTLTNTRRSIAETSVAAMKFNQYRQDLGIPESYKISYPHYYEDAINPCPSDYLATDPSANMVNGTLGTNNSGAHQPRDRQTSRYGTGSANATAPTPPSPLANNLSTSGGNIHYSELPNHGKTAKSKRSSSSSAYARAEQVLGVASTRNSNHSPPASNGSGTMTTTTTPTTTTTSVSSANTTSLTNGSSSSPSATNVPATSANPPNAHYAELHFRDVGREIDV